MMMKRKTLEHLLIALRQWIPSPGSASTRCLSIRLVLGGPRYLCGMFLVGYYAMDFREESAQKGKGSSPTTKLVSVTYDYQRWQAVLRYCTCIIVSCCNGVLGPMLWGAVRGSLRCPARPNSNRYCSRLEDPSGYWIRPKCLTASSSWWLARSPKSASSTQRRSMTLK